MNSLDLIYDQTLLEDVLFTFFVQEVTCLIWTAYSGKGVWDELGMSNIEIMQESSLLSLKTSYILLPSILHNFKRLDLHKKTRFDDRIQQNTQ